MRTQDQRSQPSDFMQGMILKDQSIRKDLDYVEPINQSMKQTTEKYKRKLNSSHSTEVIGFRPQPLPGNLVTWQRPIHGQLSVTHSPQPNTQTLFFRRGAPEVPEENDDQLALLHKELMASRRENERLNQIIAQNHAKAIETIGQLQIALRTANIDNERIKAAFEASVKQANDGRDRPQGKQSTCTQCPALFARIQELEHIRSQLSRRLDEEMNRRSEFNRSMDTFRETMNSRFSEMEVKLHSKSQEVIRLEQNNMELSRRLSEREHQLTQHTAIIQEYHSISEVYERTVAECTRLTTEVQTLETKYRKSQGQLTFLSSKIESLYSQLFRGEERDRSDLGVMMQELEHRVAEIRYSVQYRMAENQDLEGRLAEKDGNMHRLSEEYASALERVNQMEQIQIQYKQRLDDLQIEVNRLRSSQSSPSFQQNQFFLKERQLEEIINVERQTVSDLQETIKQRERTISDLEIHIQTITEQYDTLNLHYQEEQRRYEQIINKITVEKQAIRQAKTGLNQQKRQQESRDETFAEREELLRRLQQSEAALEELNRQPLAEYKRIGELEELVTVMKEEITRYETIVAHSRTEQVELHRQNQQLIQQINIYQQEFREREEGNKPQQEQKVVALMQQEIRKEKEDNRRLINEIEKLQSAHFNRLKEAEDYISRLLQQIQTQKKVVLRQETTVIENRTLVHQKQVLLSQNQSLRIQLQQTIKHLQEQSTQNPSQRDTNVTIEISNLRVKNDELSTHLQSAGRYISSLEEQINRLTKQDQQLRIVLKEERQAKTEIQRAILNKDALIQKLSVEFNEEVANRNKMIENLQRRLDESTHLPSFTSYNDSQYGQKSEQTTQIVKELQESVFTLNRQKIEQQQIIINLQTAFQTERINLEKAEAYITQLLEQIQVSQRYVEDDKVAIQSLIEKNTKLSEQNQKLIREKKNVSNQMDLINAQNKKLKKQLTESTKIRTTHTDNNESKKIEQLQNHLKEAQAFIHRLQGHVDQLTRSEEIIRNQLIQQRSTHQQLQSPQDTASKEALRQAKYDIEVLARENRELKVKVQQVNLSLQKAQDYIAENLSQGGPQIKTDTTENARLKQELQKARQEKHQIQIQFQNQIRLTKDLQSQATVDQSFISEKTALINQRQSLIQQIDIVVAENEALKSKLLETSSVSPQKIVAEQQLRDLREKNEQIYSHLQDAQAFIRDLQERIDVLTKTQEVLKNQLLQERSTKQPVGKGTTSEDVQKERIIYQLQQELQKANLSIQTLTLSAQTEAKKAKVQVETEARRALELQNLLNILKNERSQQETLLATTSSDRNRLLRQVQTLSTQVKTLSAETSKQSQPQSLQDNASKEALRQAKYDNEVLARENRELKVKIQQIIINLQKAQDYIAANLSQSGTQVQADTTENVRLKQELQKARQEKHQLEISLNNQKQQLKLQINQLNNVLIQVKQQFDKNAQQAKRQVTILKQICGATPSTTQSIPTQQTLAFKTISYELTTIKSQKEGLLKSLSSAENQIIHQQQKINSLVNQQLELKNALELQIQARSRLQLLASENDAQMKRLSFMFEEELKLRDNTIDQLGKHLQEANLQIHNLNLKLQQDGNRQITNEKDRNNQLEQVINNLRLEKTQQESLILSYQQQIQKFTAENNRDLVDKSTAIQQECLSLKHEIDLISLEKQAQLKNLEKAEQYIAVLHEQINKDREQVQSLIKQRENLRRQTETISTQNKEISAKNKELSSKLESLSINFNSISADKQKLVINNQKLENDNRQNQLKLQQYSAKHLQSENQLKKLTQIIAQNKVQIEKKTQQVKKIQEDYNKLTSDLQIKQRQETEKQKEGKKLEPESIDELNSLKATNQELHTHLQTAQDFIFDLEKHLQNLVQAEAELKTTLEQERQTKRIIEVAIQEKQAVIRNLSIEVEQSNAKLNPLLKVTDQLQHEKQAAVQRAAQSESLLNDTVRQLEQLKAKLMQAQNYIFALEDEMKRLRQRLDQAQSSIIQLSEESNKLKQKVSSVQTQASQSKKDENNQQITLLQKEITNLQVERQRNTEEVQKKQANLRTLASDLERKDRIVQEAERKIKAIEEQAIFFKNKLASAEEYIAGVEKVLIQKDDTIRNQISQLERQQKHTAQIGENLTNAERKIVSLNNEISRASEKAKQLEEVIKAQQSPAELQNLQKLTNDLQERLRNSEINRENLNVAVEDLGKKLQRSQENSSLLGRQKAQAESQTINILQHLKQAQGHLQNLVQAEAELKTTLEQERQTKRIIKVAIQEKQAVIRNLSIEVEQSNAKLNPLTKIVDELQHEKQAAVQRAAQSQALLNDTVRQLEQLKAKLMQAQNYIFALEDEMKKLRQNLNKAGSNITEIQNLQRVASDLEQRLRNSEVNRENLNTRVEDLNKKLQKSQENASLLVKEKAQAEIKVGQQKKLVETQRLELEKEKQINQQTKAQLITLQNQNNLISVEVTSLRTSLQKVEKDSEFFKGKLLDAETYISQVQQALPEKQSYVKDLETKIQEAHKKIEELAESRNQLLQELSQSPQRQSIKSAQTSQIESSIQNAEFFRNKLLEAESFIHELQQQNSKIISDSNVWQEQLNSLRTENEKVKKLLAEANKVNSTLKSERDHSVARLDQETKIKEKITKDLNDQIVKFKELTDRIEKITRESKEKDVTINNLNKQNSQFLNAKVAIEQTSAPQQTLIENLRQQVRSLKIQSESLTKKIVQLQQQTQTASERANYSQGLLLETVKNVEELQGRLAQSEAQGADAESYIVNLQEENRNLRSKLAETETQDNQEVNLLRDQLKTYQTQTKNYSNENETIKLKLNQTEILNEKLVKQINQNKEDQNLLKVEINTVNKRLQEAEKYISNKDQEYIKLVNKLAQAEAHINEESKRLNAEIARAEKEISTLEVQSNTLKARLASISSQSRQEDLKQQLAVLQKEIQRLNKIREIDEERLQAKETEIRTLSAALENSQKPKVDLKPQAPEEDALFFKNKLLEAEQYIEQMEHINFTNEQIVNQQKQESRIQAARITFLETVVSNTDKANASLHEQLIRQKELNKLLTEAGNKQITSKQIIALQNKNKQLEIKVSEAKEQKIKNEKATEELIQHVSQLNGLVADLKKEKENSDNQATFFKGKLFQAENYITELQESTHTNEELANKIKENVLLQDQIKELTKDLNTQRGEKQVKDNQLVALQKTAKELEEESEFFRKKLLEAETYINHLQQTIHDQEKIEEERQRTAAAETLAKAWEAKVKEADSKNKELSIMNQELMSQLSDRRQNEEIRRLEDSVVQLRSALQKSQAENKILKSRISQEKSSQKASQKQSSPQGIDFKAKLLEAESYIHELEQENNQLGEKVEELNTLREDFEECNRLLEEAEERSRTLAAELGRTGEENQLVKQSKLDLEDKVTSLVKEIDTLKTNLADVQTYTSSHESPRKEENTNELFNKLKEAERKLEQAQTIIKESNKAANKLQEIEAKLREAQNYIQSKDSELIRLTNQLRESELKLEEGQINLQEEVRNKYAVLNDLTTKLHQSEAERQILLTEQQKKQAQIVNLSNKLHEIEGKLQKIQSKPQTVATQILEKKTQNQIKLQQALQSLQNQIQRREEAEDKFLKSQEICDALQQQLTILGNSPKLPENYQRDQARLKEAETELLRLTAEVEQKNVSITTLLSELQRQRETKQLQQNELVGVKKETSSQQKPIEGVQEDLSYSRQLQEQQHQKLNTSKPIQHQGAVQRQKIIELQFLGDKLKQAEELIIQQQNEITRLTDELIHFQNDSNTLKRQLSTKRREEEDMEDAIRELSTTQQGLIERVEPLEQANRSLREQVRNIREKALQLEEDNAILSEKIGQQAAEVNAKESRIQTLEKENNQLAEQVSSPPEEDHEKFIELEAEVLQLKEGNDLLWKDLQDLRRDNDRLQQTLTFKEEENKQLSLRVQEASQQSVEIENLLQQSKENLEAKNLLAQQNQKLRNTLQEGMSSSTKLSLHKETFLNQEIDLLKDKLTSEVAKVNQLEGDIDQRDAIITDLQNQLNAALFDLSNSRQTADRLIQTHEKVLRPLQQQLQVATQEAARLNGELAAREVTIQQLVPLVNEKEVLLAQNMTLTIQNGNIIAARTALLNEAQQIRKEVKTLKEDKQHLLSKLKEAETYIVSLQDDANNAASIFKNVAANAESLKHETDTLKQELRRASAEKEKLLTDIRVLQEWVELAQSDNQKLNSKVSYLHSLTEAKDQEIASLSELSRERERQKEEKSRSDEPQGNVIPEELKENGRNEENSVRQLSEQIRSLTAELQRKEEENRQLMVQRLNLQDQLNELQQQLALSKEHDANEELHQHLVEADRVNLELQEHNKQLTAQAEALARDKAYLQFQLTQLKTNTPQTSQQNDTATLKLQLEQALRELEQFRPELEQAKQQLHEERVKNEELLVIDVQNDSLKHLKEDLQAKLQAANAEKARLLQNLTQAQQAIVGLQTNEAERRQEEEQMARRVSLLEEELDQANSRIGELEAQAQQDRRQEVLGEDLKRLLGGAGQQIDEQDIMQHLENFPYLQEFIKSILYRLRLSSALQLQKSLKIKQLNDDIRILQEQLQGAHRQAAESRDMKAANEFLRGEIIRLQEQRRSRQEEEQARYDEALGQILNYSELNNELKTQLAEISEIADQYKERIQTYEQQAALILDSSSPSQDNDLSQENYELRRRLQTSERLVEMYKADSSVSAPSREVFYAEFLNGCLQKVVDLQREVREVEREIQRTALQGTQRSQPSEELPQDSLQQRLQELEDKLLRNAHHIQEHQQRSDGELYDLLHQLAEARELPQASRARIEDYLAQLEQQILREHEQHQSEVLGLKNQLASYAQPSGRSSEQPADSARGTREQLLREITHLNNAIEIYYQESMRRKKNYRRTLESLFRDISRLGDQPNPNPAIAQMAERIRFALEDEDKEDRKQMEMGDDFIITSGNVQILEREQTTLPLGPGEDREVQTEDDAKPFLAFLLSNQGLQKDDLRLLKRKVAELRSREVEENLAALKGQEKRLQQLLQLSGREAPQQLDNIMVTLANTYSRDQISQIFGSEDNDELLNKLNEALEESFLRGDSATMLQNILERKNRYYDSPTKLSEQVHDHLVALLSAKRDEDFYEQVDGLFRDLYQIQVGFQEALRKKDELYRFHNERMNQIFNRSSSEGSEQYMTLFEREGQEHSDPDPLEMRSQRKPRRSEPGSENDIEQ